MARKSDFVMFIGGVSCCGPKGSDPLFQFAARTSAGKQHTTGLRFFGNGAGLKAILALVIPHLLLQGMGACCCAFKLTRAAAAAQKKGKGSGAA